MIQVKAQIWREADNQFTLLFSVPGTDGLEDLNSNQPNLANANAALDALKPLVAAAIPVGGSLHRVYITAVIREPVVP